MRGKLNKDFKKGMVNPILWSVVLYGLETWLMREDIRRLEDFQMWMWRRIERVSWTVKNETHLLLPTSPSP